MRDQKSKKLFNNNFSENYKTEPTHISHVIKRVMNDILKNRKEKR